MSIVHRRQKFLFAVSGLLVLIVCINSPVLLPYPLFVLAYLLNWRLPIKGSPEFRLLISTLCCTFLLETSAWLDNFIRNNPDPPLFHPQLIPDVLIGIGVYLAWWLTWWLVSRRYHFTIRQVFLVTGLYGIFLEQEGAVFLAGLATMPLGFVLWLFVAVAYGSTMALAFFLVRDSFTAERESRWKYPITMITLFVVTYGTAFIWGIMLLALDFLPAPKLPMQDYPLW